MHKITLNYVMGDDFKTIKKEEKMERYTTNFVLPLA